MNQKNYLLVFTLRQALSEDHIPPVVLGQQNVNPSNAEAVFVF